MAGSLLLHGLLLTAAIMLALRMPPPQVTPLRPLLVEIVPPPGLKDQGPASPVPARTPRTRASQGPRGAPKPEGVRPHGTKPFDDPLAVQLKSLAKLRAPRSDLKIQTDGSADITAGQGNGEAAAYAVRDAIRAAILRRWSLNLAVLKDRHLVITLAMHLSGGGRIASLAIEGEAAHKRDAQWLDIAISARNAALLSAPFPLPESLSAKGLDVTIRLDPRETVR